MSTEKPVLLKRNPLLERLVQPMNEDGRRRLKSEIIRNPDNIVIHSWQGFILFDYDKYDLCRLLHITFTVKDHSFGSFDEAASFACSSQLVRNDLTGEYRKYLIGQKFHFEENITLADPAEKNISKYQIDGSIKS